MIQALLNKTKIIREELGSLSPFLEARPAKTRQGGIQHAGDEKLARTIDRAKGDRDKRSTTEGELETSRARQDQRRQDIALLQRRADESRKWIGLDNELLPASPT